MAHPFTPVGAWFGFHPPPFKVTASVGLLVIAYLACAELLKELAVGPLSKRLSSVKPV